MMAYKSISKPVTILVALLMAVTAFAVIAADNSDAASDVRIYGDKIKADGFKNDADGTLVVPVKSDLDGITVTMVVKEGSKVLKTQNYEINNGDTDLKMTLRLNEGRHEVNITISIDDVFQDAQSANINVGNNVWTNVTTYVAIIIVAIIVVIIAVVYMRANPRNKPTTTFTQLEEEKAAKAAQDSADEPKAEKKGTDKVKYVSSRRK